MSMEYRRLFWSRVWHYCTNCSHWPMFSFFARVRYTRPTYGTLCDECQSKDSRNICTPVYSSASSGVGGMGW